MSGGPSAEQLAEAYLKKVQIFHLVKGYTDTFDIKDVQKIAPPDYTKHTVTSALNWLVGHEVLEVEKVELKNRTKNYYSVNPVADLINPPGRSKIKPAMVISDYTIQLLNQAFGPKLNPARLHRDSPTLLVKMEI